VYEARAAGADAVLLIAAYLDAAELSDLHTLTCALGMAALVEVHNQD
jgi:indole-3-glycerol phosphate synthase